MKPQFSLFYCIFLFVSSILCFKIESKAAVEADGVYIVYMGAAASSSGSLKGEQNRLLNYVSRRRKGSIVRNYVHGFSGFAARLSKQDIDYIAKQPGVVSVFPDPVLKLHTTRSWDFLQYKDQEIDASIGGNPYSNSTTSDTIIGMLDTGIWPESESFDDKDMGPIPSRWSGTCMKGSNFDDSNCNKKLIGARFYTNDSARDTVGHGTHTASTAGGILVNNASDHGLAPGSAKGGAVKARLAVYKVCTNFGCEGSAILAAFDDAIADGVDVLSLSLGAQSSSKPDFSSDVIAIGSFHAVEKGITVVCSAGNSGPGSGSLSNDAPWIFTVGASSLDRKFESNVFLGGKGNKIIQGIGINTGKLKRTPVYPLLYAKSAKLTSAKDDEARRCDEGSLDIKKVKGNIILCEGDGDDDVSDSVNYQRLVDEVKGKDGVGIIVTNYQSNAIAVRFADFPATQVDSEGASKIHLYIDSTKKPVATILPTETVTDYKPAPVVAYFSSRGPTLGSGNLLKPDITAPGVDILAAWTGANDDNQTSQPFKLLSGTSMSCPHISGIAATVKSLHPSWSPSAIRSAIMTTATQMNNMDEPITTDSGRLATPYDYGAGEVRPTQSLQPGLVYETETLDYLYFLCYYGYDNATIKLISPNLPKAFSCPKGSNSDMISNMNYPSIGVSITDQNTSKTVRRTVTNVGEDQQTTYTVSVDAPEGVNVKVVPEKLVFGRNAEKLSYQVTFSSTSDVKDDVFGLITWTNGKHSVCTTIVVTSATDV